MAGIEEFILTSDDRAARRVSGISGWVDRHGHFYGDNEAAARRSGATHNACPRCESPKPKTYIFCQECLELRAEERYMERAAAEWDGDTPIYSMPADRFFNDTDDLREFLEEYPSTTVEELQLVLCEPEQFRELTEEYFLDQAADEAGLPVVLQESIANLNEIIKALPAAGWQPGKVAAILSTGQIRALSRD
ncbi:hypothetical protein DRQ53_07995 [bacterium]|nr:MAG: hypothetical protein DRQ53_07995 [bacterium]